MMEIVSVIETCAWYEKDFEEMMI